MLADYIMTLLKKDQSDKELQAYCRKNLDDFLGEETGPFVGRLFEAVRSKAYLPNADNGGEDAVADEPAVEEPAALEDDFASGGSHSGLTSLELASPFSTFKILRVAALKSVSIVSRVAAI